ncbi:hypothetical protein H8356DRAFT_1753494 [Neocallimastix lanati (nom. inval.)]|nr:hypothetical protein H8356DRAFT_1753494 [Neocallimastix sp. JGI-2020a]
MILIILFVLLCIICRVNCDLDNYGNEEISLLILAAADNNGEIAAYKNNNKWYYKTVYNGKKNNRKCYESIVDIIPELRRLYDKECRKAGIAIHSPRQRIFGTVEDYFRDELYPAALRTYNKYFSGVSNTNDVERRIKNIKNGIIEEAGIDIIPKCGILVNGRDNNDAGIYSRNTIVENRIYHINKGYKKDGDKNLHINRATSYPNGGYNDKITNLISNFSRINTNPARSEIDKVSNLSKILGLIKLYPVSLRNEQSYGITAGPGHSHELGDAINLANKVEIYENNNNNNNNNNNGLNCRVIETKNSKRGLKTGFSCNKIRVRMSYNIKDKKKINLLNIDNIDDYFNNIENNENFNDFWNKFSNTYKDNAHLFTTEERDKIIQNMNDIVNDYKDKISDSNKSDIKINEDDISNLENILYDISNYNMVRFDEDNDINVADYNNDSKSKYFKEKLLKGLKKVLKLLKKSVRIKFNKEKSSLKIDPKTIEKLSGELKNLEETSNQVLKDIAEDFDELQFITDYELYSNGEPSEDINNKISEEENNLEVIPSENNLIIDENFGNNIIDKIKSDSVSDEVKEGIIKGFEDDIKDKSDEVLVKETSDNINEIKNFVKTKEEEINKYDSLKNHKFKTIKFLKLIKYLNSLIEKFNVKDFSSQNNKNKVEKVKLNDELMNHIKTDSDKKLAIALKDINNNPLKNTNYDELSNKMAFVVLAAGDENGRLVKEIDKNGNLVPISVTVSYNGEEKQLSIKDIIPSLRNLEGEELDDKFKQFNNYYDENSDQVIFSKDPIEIIKDNNVMTFLLNPYNVLEDGNYKGFDLSPEDVYITMNTNNNLENANNFDELPEDIKARWNSDIPEEEKADESLYKALAVHCIRNTRCNNYFKENNLIPFNIVSYNSKDESKGIDLMNHSLIINDDDNKEICNAFTLVENLEGYELDKVNGNGDLFTYEELNILNNNSDNHEMNKIKINDNEYVEKFSIGFLAECGFDLEKTDGTTLKPEDYALENEEFNDVSDNEIIERKYLVKNNGKYNMNVVRSDVFDDDVTKVKLDNNNNINDISLKDFGITDNELTTLTIYGSSILGKELYNEKEGMIHYTDDNEYHSRYNNVRESLNLQNGIKDIKNERSRCTESKSCLTKTYITGSIDVEKKLIKNIKVKDEETSISSPGELCDGAETLLNVIETLLNSFENSGAITKEDSEKFITDMNEVINGLNYRYMNSNYKSHESIKDLDMNKLNNINKLYNQMLKQHVEKHGEIVDSKADTESKFVTDKLDEILKNITQLFNDDDQDLSNINIVYNMDLKYITNKLKELNVSGSEETRQEYKEKLLDIYDKVSEVEEVFDRNNNGGEGFLNNSQTIYSVKEALNTLLKSNYPIDEDVNERLNRYKDTINGFKKSEVKSSNVLTMDHIVGKVGNVYEFIMTDSKSTMYVKKYFDALKDNMFEINGNEVEEELMMEKIRDINRIINEKIEKFKKLDESKGHFEEGAHLIELISGYNELISTKLILSEEKALGRLMYMSTSKYNKVVEGVMRNNPEDFRVDVNRPIQEHIRTNNKDAQSYTFNKNTVYKISQHDFENMFNEKVNSRSEASRKIIEKATPSQLSDLNTGYRMDYKLMDYTLPSYRDADKIKEINEVSKSNKMLSDIKNNDIKYLETHEQREDRYVNNIISRGNLKNINIKKLKYSTLFSKSSNLLSKNNPNKEQVSGITKDLGNMCMNKKNEVVKLSGNVPESVFIEIYNDYNNLKSKVSISLKNAPETSISIINNSNLNVKISLVNHNKSFSNKINTKSDVIKNISKAKGIFSRA